MFTVVVWRDQAEHAAESLSKGSRVVVVGRLQQRTWTAQDGSARSTVEVVADELGQACGGRQRLTLAGWREDLVVPDRLSLKPSVGLAALTTLTLVSPG